MSVGLIDTSIFCEILDIPKMASAAATYRAELKSKADANESLLLPMTTIIETGNHIGQCSSNGATRRHFAELFTALVLKALAGDAPFRPTTFFELADLRSWLSEFSNWATYTDAHGRGSGFGDLTILKEWERQCELNPGRRVYIWSLDQRLAAYDKPPRV